MKLISSVALLVGLAMQATAGMVWVSNETCQQISAQISNKSMGSAAVYNIPAKGTYFESRKINGWGRSGAETITVTLGRKKRTFTVQPEQWVMVYIDRIQIIDQQEVYPYDGYSYYSID